MMKTLYIQSGMFMVDTTSLQQYLFTSKVFLSESGLYYPVSGLDIANPQHTPLALQIPLEIGEYVPQWYREQVSKGVYRETSRVMWEQLISELSSQEAEYIIISSEEFSRVAVSKYSLTVLKDYLKETNVVFVFFIRNHADYLESHINQLIKMGSRIELTSKIPQVYENLGKAIWDYRTLFIVFSNQEFSTNEIPHKNVSSGKRFLRLKYICNLNNNSKTHSISHNRLNDMFDEIILNMELE